MSKFWSFILLALIISGCSEADPRASNVVVLGHGGLGFPSALNQYPPNTWESVERAMAEGADGVELDVQLSADSTLILFHDKRLETQVNASGTVAESNSHDLLKLEYLSQDLHSAIHIQSLQDVIDQVSSKYDVLVVSLNIQVPEGRETDEEYRQRFARALVSFTRSQQQIHYFIESERTDYLEAIKAIDPDTDRFLIGAYTAENVAFIKAHGALGLVANYTEVSPEQAQDLKNNGLRLMVYGLKIRKDIVRSADLLPYAVQTDNISLTFSIYGYQN